MMVQRGKSGDSASLRTVYSLVGTVFVSTLGVGAFVFAFPLLALRDNISGGWLGAAFSGYFLAKFFLSPLAGNLADRFGPRPLLALSALLGATVPLAYFISQGHECLYLVQFGLGLVGGLQKPVSTAALSALAPERLRGRVFGWSNAACNAAFFLGPIVGGLLFYDMDLRPVILFLVSCMSIALFGFLFLVPRGLSTRLETADSGNKRQSAEKSGGSLGLMAAVFGRTFGIACMIAFYPVFLAESISGPKWMVGLVFALPSLVACLGLPLGGWLADVRKRTSLALAGMALCAVCLAVLGRMDTLAGFVLAGVCLGFGSALSFPASMSLASNLGRRQGRVMGLFHAVANAGFVAGPLAGGLVLQHCGGVGPVFSFAGAVGLAACMPMALWSIGRPGKRWRMLATAAGLILVVTLLFAGGLFRSSGEASQQPSESFHFAGVAMGNVVRMTFDGQDREKAGLAADRAFETISRLEFDLGHRTRAGSIGRVNLAAGKRPEQVSATAYALLERALEVCRLSGGVFDITIGAVTVLPFYYREQAEREKARLVDYRKVLMDPGRRTVFLPEKGMALDLGGMAKGTIVDEAARELRRQGVKSGLVEAGGDFYCYGDKTWNVGIQNPRGEGLLGVIRVSNAGVCGSGDYYQYAFSDQGDQGRRKHHIFDPDRLDSADKSIAVTVVAPSAELADALATTLFILGPEKGRTLLKGFHGCSALWVLPDRTLCASDGFPAFI